MGEGLAYLIGIAIALYVVYLIIVYIVLPILAVLLGIGVVILVGIAGFGFLSGLYKGITNFFSVITEAHHKLP
jgi:hypothetical protein